ncbi:MAG: serine/threonine protein kinase [Elusimicrobia bacterium]|nr:serine/threonine protein kinase [Elusimicrobiota bacterium]
MSVRLAALSLLLAGPAVGAAPKLPAQGLAALTALEAVYQRHKALVSRLDAILADCARGRLAFQTAADPASRLASWEAACAPVPPLILEERPLWEEYQVGFKRIERATFVRQIGLARRGGDQDPDPAGLLHGTLDHNTKAHASRTKALSTAAWEVRELHTAAARLRTEQAKSKQLRALLGLLAAATAALWFASRRRKAAPPGLAAPSAPSPKVVAGNFELKGLIGRGAMGEVYEAFDRTLGRRAALKRLRPELLASPEDLELLLAEARTVAALKHPNIVAIHSVERDAGQVYLAFEFIDGSSLAQAIDGRRLGWSEALGIFKACCAALRYAHSQRVIHRDLKPANVMLGRDGAVKVMDFGIAYTAQRSISRLTRAAAWGTPPYMAPEQELGGVSAGVDLFALSVCFYETLTGELPFKGPNFLAQKREALFLPVSGLVRGLPAGVDAFFKTALAPEPSKRYSSAAALSAAAEAAP